MNTVLVTGASGYIGSHLVHRLLQRGHQVVGITRENSHAIPQEGLEWHLYNGTYESIEKAFSRPITHVCHLAALATYHCPPTEIGTLIDANIKLGTFLLEAMCAHGCSHIINTGSFWEHAHSAEYAPTCLYAATKKAFGDILTHYTENKKLKCLTLKLYDVYGPGDKRGKIFGLVERAIASAQPLAMTPGEQQLIFNHISDVVSAYCVALDLIPSFPPSTHKTYFLTDAPVKLRSSLELYMRLRAQSAAIEWGKLPYRENQIMIPYCGERLPNWSPEITLEQGIKTLF